MTAFDQMLPGVQLELLAEDHMSKEEGFLSIDYRPWALPNSDIINISAQSLRRAADIQDKLEALNKELSTILGGGGGNGVPRTCP